MSPLVLPPQSYLGWKVSVILLHTIAVLSTVLRLVHRFRSRKTWWDDYILSIPLSFDLAYWIVACTKFPQPTGPNGEDNDMSFGDPISDSYWLATLPGIFILWGTRTVLALSLARMFPSKHPARRWSFVLVLIMTLLSLATIAVTIATCDAYSALLNQGEFEECIKGPGGFSVRNVFIFAENLGSQILLIVFSSVFIWRLTLSAAECRLALAVTLASLGTILCTVAFLVIGNTHALSMGRNAIVIVTGLRNIQTAISLLLCNLPIVVTCPFLWVRRLLRAVGSPSSENAGQSVTRSSSSSCCSDLPTPLTLTEISDLSCSSNHRSELSLGISYGSWHASEVSSCADVEIEEKARTPNQV